MGDLNMAPYAVMFSVMVLSRLPVRGGPTTWSRLELMSCWTTLTIMMVGVWMASHGSRLIWSDSSSWPVLPRVFFDFAGLGLLSTDGRRPRKVRSGLPPACPLLIPAVPACRLQCWSSRSRLWSLWRVCSGSAIVDGTRCIQAAAPRTMATMQLGWSFLGYDSTLPPAGPRSRASGASACGQPCAPRFHFGASAAPNQRLCGCAVVRLCGASALYLRQPVAGQVISGQCPLIEESVRESSDFS